ncbi:TPA: hypothetical protein N0F65_000199 [Lagenidium giganteum]|uniref:Vacuolar membrane protein n=1 Tax=Lagenidium giganteum TaxID=4803 RepID=A0AAV2YDI1_9STRA|nr:TPA: hypothetical protein N0F65_000199 [Lagenidium giganteum]
MEPEDVWDEDGNLQECKLLGGGFAHLLQVLLGIIALSVLVIKRMYEVPQRPLRVWAFDASKQMVGAGFAHVANLVIALMLYQYEHDREREAAKNVDQCAFYFVNFTMDTTFGVLLNWLILAAFSQAAVKFNWTSQRTPGDYGNPPRVSLWLKQLSAWILVIFVTKMIIAFIILLLEQPLSACAIWLFKPLQPYPRVELAIVMIACPCLMNALQFWVQDNFLKKDMKKGDMIKDTESPEELDDVAQPSTSKAAAKKLNLSPTAKKLNTSPTKKRLNSPV